MTEDSRPGYTDKELEKLIPDPEKRLQYEALYQLVTVTWAMGILSKDEAQALVRLQHSLLPMSERRRIEREGRLWRIAEEKRRREQPPQKPRMVWLDDEHDDEEDEA